MKVKQRMTTPVVTATTQTSHSEAVKLMQDHNIRRLPVLNKKGKLVGIVTEKELLTTSPSPATTLSIYEIVSLLHDLKLESIMTKPVYTVDEECDIAEGARLMVEKSISALPIMRGDEVAGIITETDIFRAFVEALGGNAVGLRFDIDVQDRQGMLLDISRAVTESGGNIISLTTFDGVKSGRRELSIVEQGADPGKLRQLFIDMPDVDMLSLESAGEEKYATFG